MRAIYKGTYGSPTAPTAYTGKTKYGEVLDVPGGFYGGTKVVGVELRCKGRIRSGYRRGEKCDAYAVVKTGYCYAHSDATEALLDRIDEPVRQCKGVNQNGQRCSVKRRQDYCGAHYLQDPARTVK